MENYKVDQSVRQINIQVQAGVVGVAETRVYLKIVGNFKRILKSEKLANGNISFSKVEKNKNLSGALLKVRTVLNLSNLTVEERKKAIDNILIIYSLKGGPNGIKKVIAEGLDINSTNDTLVIITKLIEFI